MIATLDGREIPAATVTLDDIAWDHAGAAATPHEAQLSFSDAELLVVGRSLVEYAQACVAEEPDYFSSQPAVPIPTSEALFVGNAQLVAQYLADPFWRREMMIAMLEVGRGPRVEHAPILIQQFRAVKEHAGGATVLLGASERAPRG